jgi:hypothetical protein
MYRIIHLSSFIKNIKFKVNSLFFVPGSGMITRSLYTMLAAAGLPLFVETFDVVLPRVPRLLLLEGCLPWLAALSISVELALEALVGRGRALAGR